MLLFCLCVLFEALKAGKGWFFCVVHCSCTEYDTKRLEDMQLNFARFVKFIYNETQRPKLSESGQDCNKIFMFKVVNNLVPPYLCMMLPPIIQDSVDHKLRKKQNFRYLDAKTERHKNSLFPSIVQS